MTDDYTQAEIVRRLSAIEVALRDLSLRVVSAELYTAHRAELERRFTEVEGDIDAERQSRREQAAELEKDLEAERQARRDRDREIRAEIAGQSTNWRQAIYAGVIPGVLFLIGILLQLKGGK